MADYFIGDTHFGCQALLSVRTAFQTTQEMDNFILDNWASRVTNHDHVYILGDLFDRSFQDPESYLHRMPGQKHLLLGNHDYDWIASVDPSIIGRCFVEIEHVIFIRRGSCCLTLCHYPMLEWYNSNRDAASYLIHAHIHTRRNRPSFAYIQQHLPQALNCCPEINHYFPVTLEELIANNKQWYSI